MFISLLVQSLILGWYSILLFCIISRILFSLKLQGASINISAICVVEGLGYFTFLILGAIFILSIKVLIISMLFSSIFLLQVFYEEKSKVILDIPESELEEFLKKFNQGD